MTKPPTKEPPNTDAVELVVSAKSELARRSTLEQNPVALYMMSLNSSASRRSMMSALGRASRIFDALDRNILPKQSDATPLTYQWTAPGGLTVAKVTAAIGLIKEERGEDGAKKISMARLVHAALRGMAKTLFGVGALTLEERQKIDDVKAPKLSGKTRGRRLTDAEIARLFAACARDTTPFGRRDAAILSVMLGTGLRRFEVSALDVSDYHPPLKLGRAPAWFLVQAGKGYKRSDVAAPPDVAVALERWLDVRGRHKGPLFLSSGGRGRPLDTRSRLSESGVYLVCTTRGAEARVELAPHDLRRTFITKYIETSKDLALAQKAARHSDPKTTSKYDMRKQAELMAAAATMSSGFEAASHEDK